MYYYQHHIGDFDRATRHLTRVERSIYLDLLFQYYETERALTLDMGALCRKIVARSEEEKAAVVAVLSEFFHQAPSGWFHDRCEEELAAYRKTKSQASDAGKASAAARAERRRLALAGIPTEDEHNGNENPTTVQRPFNDRSTTVEDPFNGSSTGDQREPNEHATGGQPTNNHEPVTRNQKPKSRKTKTASPVGDDVLFPDVDPKVIDDFRAIRKQKRAPVTETAMEAIKDQAKKAGMTLEAALRVCCARGWSGFNAEWIERRNLPALRGNKPSINDFGNGAVQDDDPFNGLKKEWTT